MENNIPIVTIDKKLELKANREFSHFFKEKTILTKKVGEILKKIGFNTSKQYIIEYEGQWVPSHKQIYVCDTENETMLRLTFDIYLGYRTISIEEYKNEQNKTIKLTNTYYYNKTNDDNFELTLSGYRKNVIRIPKNKIEQAGSFVIENFDNLFRIYNFLNSGFDYILYFEKENNEKLTLDKETEERISNEMLAFTRPDEFIKITNNIINILKDNLENNATLLLSIITKSGETYGKISIENGKLVNAIIPITNERKFTYKNDNNMGNLKEDLDAIKDETEAIQNEIKRREKCKRRELKR